MKLQEKLGVSTDGQFGPCTHKALRTYQAQNGLVRTAWRERSHSRR